MFRDKLHEGVLRDVQRQEMRKRENLYNLQRQIDLTKELKRREQLEAANVKSVEFSDDNFNVKGSLQPTL